MKCIYAYLLNSNFKIICYEKITIFADFISFFCCVFYGLTVGVYKIFSYELLDSSKNILFGQKTIENNQFVNQADIDSLIKIDNKPDINQKRNFR